MREPGNRIRGEAPVFDRIGDRFAWSPKPWRRGVQHAEDIAGALGGLLLVLRCLPEVLALARRQLVEV
jgi:hypothetical protein